MTPAASREAADSALSHGDDHLLIMHQPMMSCRLCFYNDVKLIAGGSFSGMVKLGLSESAISLALNHKPAVSTAMRKRVLAAAEEFGCRRGIWL